MSFNRKRRFGNDDYHQPYQKRFRLPPIVELAKTLCGDMNTLGESAKRYVEDVEFMSVPIETNFEVEETFRNAVLQTLYAITTQQPHKILHIAGLVQAVHTKNRSIGNTIAQFFHRKAQTLLGLAVSKDFDASSSETGPWNKLKLILRFWASLSYVIDEASILDMFKQFLRLAVDLQKDSFDKRVPLAEAIYYNTLISIPYIYPYQREVSPTLKEGVEALLSLAAEFPIIRSDIGITRPFVEQSNEVPYKPEEIVTLILPALKTYLETEEIGSVFPDLDIALSDLISPVEKMSLPPLAMPELSTLKEFSGLDTGLGSVDGMWRTPRLTFEIYVPLGDLQTTPSSNTYTGLILRDLITDIIEAMEFNRKEVARQIITIDLFFKENLFAPPGMSIDKLRDITEGSTFKVEDVAVETVLSLIYKLPTASQPFVYFYTTLVEACVNASQAIAPVMGRAIRFFYTQLHHLDFELRFRYLDWLSVQLSNFNFTWKWREWEADSLIFANSLYHPRGVFVRNLISKELRLATLEKVQGTLTEEFQKYLDISLFSGDEMRNYYSRLLPNLEQQADSKLVYLDDNVPFRATVEKLIEAIHKDEKAHDEVIEVLKTELSEYENADELLVSIVFQVVVFVGNRSISHAGKYIASSADSLKKLVDAVDQSGDNDMEVDVATSAIQKQKWAIDAVLQYWNPEPQNGYLVIDILESFQVISSGAILEHSLDDDREKNLGLVNVSATEAVLRTLTKLVYSGSASAELNSVYNTMLQILANTVEKLGTEGLIEIPDVTAEVTDEVELKWKYHTVLGFVRMMLRKFSDEYVTMSETMKNSLQKTITHKSTSDVVSTWITDLASL